MYGIFSYDFSTPRVGWKYGEFILDLEIIGLLGFFDGLSIDPAVFAQPALNDFISLGKSAQQTVRQRLDELLCNNASRLAKLRNQAFIHESRAQMHLPVRIGDYTDFYAGIHHAENVGRMFRPNGDALLPNYKHLPVAYHGRASSIVVSGTPIRRPNGQFLGSDNQPVFGPSQALDFELEIGLIIGKSNPLGEPVSVDEAEDYIFGITLFNDWSARDIQRWEYQPLGPFLGKNFGSSLSAWVLPFDELKPFRVAGPVQEPILPYLRNSRPDSHFDINLEVWLQPADGQAVCICRTNARHLYWSFAQMIAHHTVGGCNLNIGDVLATGTISGPDNDKSESIPGSYGSLLELSWNGTQPVILPDGSTRTFLLDGDVLTLRANAGTGSSSIELGPVTGQIQPAFQRE